MNGFSLDQVERITGVSGAKIAYWLKEFPELQALTRESVNGETALEYEALGLVLRIQLLLEEVGLTISGARRQLRLDGAAEPCREGLRERLLRIRRELEQTKQILEN